MFPSDSTSSIKQILAHTHADPATPPRAIQDAAKRRKHSPASSINNDHARENTLPHCSKHALARTDAQMD
eukprot:2984337-Alexandrium_andersonii.AAC.1